MNELPLIIVVGSATLAIGVTLGSIARALLCIRDELVRLHNSIERMRIAIEQQGGFNRNLLGH